MANLKSIFVTGVDTVFNVFNEAVKLAIYTVADDDGFGTDSVVTVPDVLTILDKFSQKDVESSSFYKLIQPTDTMGLVPGKFFDTVPCKTGNTLTVEGRVFSIVGFDTDPYNVLYTILLRDL